MTLNLKAPESALVHTGTVVGVTNQKGGAGKTTTTVNLAAALAEEGARVRVLDADPQKASLTSWLPPQYGDTPTEEQYDLGHVYLGECTLDQATYPTTVPNLDVVPSYKSLTKFENDPEIIGKDMLLSRALRKSERSYDLTLVDHAPSLQQNALTSLIACDAVIIPALAGGLDLEGVSDLNETLAAVRDMYRPDQRVVAVVVTQAQNNNLTDSAVALLQEDYPEAVHAKVRYTVRVREAPVAREPLTEFAPSSTAAWDYKALAEALFAPIITAARERNGSAA